MLSGDMAAAEADAALGAMLTIVRGDNPLGDFGIYKAVVEMVPGWESFTPGPEARPTLGEANARSLSPTVKLTVYIPGSAPEDAISTAIDQILAVHPWETPVIEIIETCLIRREA